MGLILPKIRVVGVVSGGERSCRVSNMVEIG